MIHMALQAKGDKVVKAFAGKVGNMPNKMF